MCEVMWCACGCKRLAAARAQRQARAQLQLHKIRSCTAAEGCQHCCSCRRGEIGGYRRHGRRWTTPNSCWGAVQAARGAGWAAWEAEGTFLYDIMLLLVFFLYDIGISYLKKILSVTMSYRLEKNTFLCRNAKILSEMICGKVTF